MALDALIDLSDERYWYGWHEKATEALRTALAYPEPEPVESAINKLFDASKHRIWVGLTDDEKLTALVSVDGETKRLPEGFKDFARAIETKLKEKNT